MTELWVRIGDGGEYESFGDDFAALADSLVEAGAGEVFGWRGFGVITEQYQGNNYISIYWGDAEANGIRDLSARERKQVEKLLASAVRSN
jgi:hypothetical protein